MMDGETTNDDLRELLLAFQRESRADRLALWTEVRALQAGDVVSATDVAEIKQALAWQLRLHAWVVKHKVNASIRVALIPFAIAFANQAMAALLRWLGWN